MHVGVRKWRGMDWEMRIRGGSSGPARWPLGEGAAKKHNLTVNLTTFRVWCYVCEREVFLEKRAPTPTSGAHQCKASEQENSPPALNHPLRAVPIAVADDGESESEEDHLKPRGLTGMKNIGNSCYMNAALQALSNCPPLTQFFLECGGLVRTDKKPALCKIYQKLISELWHKKRPSYIVPTSLSHGIKLVNPMFRGYAQQDTQEFLRCLMDQLHEELKEPLAECEADERCDGDRSPSEDEFLSCDSGSSSDRGEGCDTRGPGEAELLIQDECGGSWVGISEKERLKERRFSGSPRHAGSQEMDEDADVDTTVEEGGPQKQDGDDGPSLNRTSGRNCGTEPDNEASMNCSSHPCSPTPAQQDSHPKVSSSPPRSSPLRAPGTLSTTYSLKKGKRPAVSTTVEMFQDLSLPIPGKEDLAKLHSSIHQNAPMKTGTCSDAYASQGWISYIMEYIRRLRNGVKYCKVLRLPEILCIHLKRFRHEVMYSFKINSHVSFPLEGLDLRPFLAKESSSQITTYDLLSVICHHGTAGSGHYIAYCQNVINGQWYEFDDQYVTEVHETVVQNAEAYVLFYRKSNEESLRERQKVVALANMKEPSLLQFYISREWLNKFNTFTEPGPISNHTFLCPHGGIPPNKYHYIDDLVVILPQNVWDYLYNRKHPRSVCAKCANIQLFIDHKHTPGQTPNPGVTSPSATSLGHFESAGVPQVAAGCPEVAITAMSSRLVMAQEVNGTDAPPGSVYSCHPGGFVTRVAVPPYLRLCVPSAGADYGQISEETWTYLFTIYGGGPEIAVRQSVAQPDAESLHNESKIEAETRAV
ncbi:UBP20 hydrolase, partial [Polypterus senegalus]